MGEQMNLKSRIMAQRLFYGARGFLFATKHAFLLRITCVFIVRRVEMRVNSELALTRRENTHPRQRKKPD